MADLEELESRIANKRASITTEEGNLNNYKITNPSVGDDIKECKMNLRILKYELDMLESKPRSFFGFINTRRDRQKMEINRECAGLERIIESKEEQEAARTSKVMEMEGKIRIMKDDLADLEKEVNSPGTVWPSYPEYLNKENYTKYLEYFKELPENFSWEGIPNLNLLMLGETASGKSSFLNTCRTAFNDNTYLRDICRVTPMTHVESTTKTLHLQTFETTSGRLPIRFFDCPGITKDGTFGLEAIKMIVNGEIKPNTEIMDASVMRTLEDRLRKKPGCADWMHCIIYVVSAKSDLTNSKSLSILRKVHQKKGSKEDGPREFVLVTAIDQIVPNKDILRAFTYPCLKQFCQRVSEKLDIPLTNVLPMSNYYEEAAPTIPKDCMALMNLWRIVSSGKSFIDAVIKCNNAPRNFFE